MIANHYSAKLSDRDLEMVKEVPPGGNWKDIPSSIPSLRLEQIRRGYAAGNGSRSTYYGRLRPNQSAYTISTYFNRPGNGCFIHYDFEGGQHRLISQREAARLQSFPDDFVFCGAKTSIFKQIGNAVPPLLGYHIAKSLGAPGVYSDLFCGAGGLSLGFKWAGWQPLTATDIDPSFLETYRTNIHGEVILGDITRKDIAEKFVTRTKSLRAAHKDKPFFILGGPPCQGFSTAGDRSIVDARNYLFRNYQQIVAALQPDGFVFENVMGILTMDEGRFFKQIKNSLEEVSDRVDVWKLNAADYAVPQKRKRVIIIGHSKKTELVLPIPVTPDPASHVSAGSSLSDLPKLRAGEDGSEMRYASPPRNAYQKLMRGKISAADFLESLG